MRQRIVVWKPQKNNVQQCVKVAFGNGQMIFFKYLNIKLYCILDKQRSRLPDFPPTDTTGQAGAFGNPVAIFAGVDDDLAHTE